MGSTLFYAINITNGKKVWSGKIRGSLPMVSFTTGDTLFISAYDYDRDLSNIYAISENGDIKHILMVQSLVTSILVTPKCGYTNRESVYVGTDSGKIYLIDYQAQNDQYSDNNSVYETVLQNFYLYIMLTVSVICVVSIFLLYYFFKGMRKRGWIGVAVEIIIGITIFLLNEVW